MLSLTGTSAQWGFRRCEDVCWIKTNKKNATPSLRHDSHTLLQHSKVLFYQTSIVHISQLFVLTFRLRFSVLLLLRD
jgi:hypothetical protein